MTTTDPRLTLEDNGRTLQLDEAQAERIERAGLVARNDPDDARLHPRPGVSWEEIERHLAE